MNDIKIINIFTYLFGDKSIILECWKGGIYVKFGNKNDSIEFIDYLNNLYINIFPNLKSYQHYNYLWFNKKKYDIVYSGEGTVDIIKDLLKKILI